MTFGPEPILRTVRVLMFKCGYPPQWVGTKKAASDCRIQYFKAAIMHRIITEMIKEAHELFYTSAFRVPV